MSSLGIALLVGGMALLCSGLILLLPYTSKRGPPTQEPFEESQRRLQNYLREMKRTSGEAKR
jgi:hypothetical protein